MASKKLRKMKEWQLNWNLLVIIVGITLVLEVVVVLISFPIERKGFTILGLTVAVAVIGYFAYFSHDRQRKLVLHLQGIEPMKFRHAGGHLNLVLTVIISGTIFIGISYIISAYLDIPLYFSIPEITFGVMLTVTKNISDHELLGKTLLIRVSFIELYIPIDNIKSIWADDNRLPDLPKDIKIPRRYRAVSAYFGYRVFITLKNPQSLFFLGLHTTKKTDKILFDVDDPDKFISAILKVKPELKVKS
jgi:hypothetical protein